MFEKSAYLVKERVALAKFSDTYDIIDLENGQRVAVAQEKPGWLVIVGRFIVNKGMLPTRVFIAPTEGAEPVLSIDRGWTFLRSKVMVKGADGAPIGYFKSRVLSMGGAFDVFTADDKKVAEVKGDWKGWNFKFTDAVGKPIGVITKKWGGLGKELFTSADNYVVELSAGQNQAAIMLLMAAAIAVDTVFKE